MRVLVTGATGFVGGSIIQCLSGRDDILLRAVARRALTDAEESDAEWIVLPNIDDQTDWASVLADVDVVIHTIARTHVIKEKATNPVAEFNRINVDLTCHLAQQAGDSGVGRFIFLSSVKVNGETTHHVPFKPEIDVVPADPYGFSKYEAEQRLREIGHKTGMEVVIIRPPLVYGPGVKANFRSLMDWVYKGVPLPFGCVRNRRSLIGLANLVNFTVTCISHPKAANETFLISDNQDVSTAELIKKVGESLGRKVILLPVPVSWMSLLARLLGKKDVAQRLFSSLQVDCSKAVDLLGWRPILTMDQQLQKTADEYILEKSR